MVCEEVPNRQDEDTVFVICFPLIDIAAGCIREELESAVKEKVAMDWDGAHAG